MLTSSLDLLKIAIIMSGLTLHIFAINIYIYTYMSHTPAMLQLLQTLGNVVVPVHHQTFWLPFSIHHSRDLSGITHTCHSGTCGNSKHWTLVLLPLKTVSHCLGVGNSHNPPTTWCIEQGYKGEFYVQISLTQKLDH